MQKARHMGVVVIFENAQMLNSVFQGSFVRTQRGNAFGVLTQLLLLLGRDLVYCVPGLLVYGGSPGAGIMDHSLGPSCGLADQALGR